MEAISYKREGCVESQEVCLFIRTIYNLESASKPEVAL